MRLRFAVSSFLFLLLAGCSGNNDITTTHQPPNVVAVTSADSVAVGEGLEVKIHWRSTATCQVFEGVAFQQINDTTFTALAIVKETHDPDNPCSARDTILEGGFVLKDPPTRAFRVVVYGAAQQDTIFVQGGATPAAIERHILEIEDAASGGPVLGGQGTYTDLSSAVVFAALTTDATGTADTALACAGTSRGYKISVVGSSGRRATLVFKDRPERCGVPERTWIRL